MIDIYVGSERIKFVAHANILNQSSFFGRCLRSGMRETQQCFNVLPEDYPEDFAVLNDWLYSRCCPGVDDARLSAIISVYTIANKYGIVDLGNNLINAFRSAYRKVNIRMKRYVRLPLSLFEKT
jgi:hypothetical protein